MTVAAQSWMAAWLLYIDAHHPTPYSIAPHTAYVLRRLTTFDGSRLVLNEQGRDQLESWTREHGPPPEPDF
jgi:hypothetical protein